MPEDSSQQSGARSQELSARSQERTDQYVYQMPHLFPPGFLFLPFPHFAWSFQPIHTSYVISPAICRQPKLSYQLLSSPLLYIPLLSPLSFPFPSFFLPIRPPPFPSSSYFLELNQPLSEMAAKLRAGGSTRICTFPR